MLDALAKVISEADSAGVFLDAGHLNALANYVVDGQQRINVVSCIAGNTSTIVANTARALFLEQPQLIALGGAAYTNRRMASCLRDLEIILRYVTYATLAGDVSVLDDKCLNGLQETYQALNVPLDSVALAIGTMKLVTITVINHEVSLEGSKVVSELSVYFDHAIDSLCISVDKAAINRALEKLEKSESIAASDTTAITTYESWEPDTYIRWRDQDKLVQKLQQYGDIEDSILFEESALDFFESWKQMPSKLKRQVWREREVMAALYERMMVDWKDIKGFHSIAVAERVIENKAQLTGILVFDFPVLEDCHLLFNFPTHLHVKSSIQPLQKEEETIPLLVEWVATPAPRSGDIIDVKTVAEALPPLTTPLMQSGDSIAGCNQFGRVSFKQAVTLTTFVIPVNSVALSDIRLLTVNHGFQPGYSEVHSCRKTPSVKIGKIVYTSPVQEELARKLDVSLVKPIVPIQTNPLLKWIPVIPRPPVILTRGMLVQMYGGVSGHQTGYIDYSGFMNFGPVSSAVPNFTAQISSQPGDSGSLLVIGNDTGDPFINSAIEGYEEEFLKTVRFAMAGMLVEGSTSGTYPNMTIFRPISTIFQQLKVKAAYPSLELSISTKTFQSHAEDDKYSSTN